MGNRLYFRGRRVRRDKTPAKLAAGVRTVEVGVILACAISLSAIVPLRDVLGDYPLVLYLGALTLFITPGVLLAHWLFRDVFYGLALLPAGAVFSTSIFGLIGVPLLITHGKLDLYLLICGAVVAAFLVLAGVFVLSGRTGAVSSRGRPADRDPEATQWLRVLFISLVAMVALGPKLGLPLLDGDTWVYAAHVREHLNAEKLAVYDPYFGTPLDSMSRVKINGWLLEQAALSRLSGVDPLELILHYLGPVLTILALLSFYTLARTLFRAEAAALFAGSLYALFLLAYLGPSTLTFGGEFVGRIVQDKFGARFLFLPLALALAGLYVRKLSWRHLFGFALVCWGVVAVHPIGLAIIGLCVAGFGALYVAVNWREPSAWSRVAALGAAISSVAVVPAVPAILSGNSLSALRYSADIAGTVPQVLANQVFVREEWRHIFVLEGGNYIMHPYLLTTPAVLVGYLLGVPFLAWRLRRSVRSVAAPLLLGALMLATVVSYVPPVSTFVGERVVGAGQLWRLAWPIPALLILSLAWVGWHLGRQLGSARALPRRVRNVGAFLPIVMVVVLGTFIVPGAGARLLANYEPEQSSHQTSSCFDPFFGWMRKNLDERSTILAPANENLCIPAYSAEANVVSLRGPSLLDHLPELEKFAGSKITVPQHMSDVRRFFGDLPPEERIEILHRYSVDYVLALQGSLPATQIADSPGFTRLDTPGQRYVIYAVNLRELHGRPTG